MQLKKITGFILNIRPHLEFDRIVSVFSSEFGRVYVFAKGVRRITSHRGSHLDLFNYVEMEVEESSKTGRAKKYLREVAAQQPFKSLKNKPTSFAAACIIASFLERMLPEDSPERTVFRLTQKTFHALDSGSEAKKILFMYFLKTLRVLGHLPPILPKRRAREMLWRALQTLDPQLTLNARRTLGIFSSFESSLSS